MKIGINSSMKQKHYVYAYLREDLSPYYIGKGTGKRAYDKRHSINLPTDLSRIVFLENDLTNEQAIEIEVNLIARYGRKDLGTGILRNLTDGGEGMAGYKQSKEHIAKRVATAIGVPKPAEQVAKQVATRRSKGYAKPEAFTFAGRKHTAESKQKNREASLKQISRCGNKNPRYPTQEEIDRRTATRKANKEKKLLDKD